MSRDKVAPPTSVTSFRTRLNYTVGIDPHVVKGDGKYVVTAETIHGYYVLARFRRLADAKACLAKYEEKTAT